MNMITTQEILKNAKAAKLIPASLSADKKNEALKSISESLLYCTETILKANAEDMESARGKISDVMLDRLKLDEARIKAMADGIMDVVSLPDPVGRILSETVRPNGMKITKVSVPAGVLAIIYESRPNVTSDAAALALKSGNVCVLRSGKEAFKTAYAIVEAMREGLKKAGLSENLINLIQDTSRKSAEELMTANGYIDLLIPRGGAGLIKTCVENATVPCIQTGTGICHIYVDEGADLEMAIKIIENAKTSRPSVCNAEEVLLVNEKEAESFLPMVKKKLVDERIAAGKQPVELRLCEKSAAFVEGTRAGAEDFDTEFLDYILAVKIVENVAEAIEHINAHSTMHSEAIITESEEHAKLFTGMVDSACVYVNTSTRFTDGGEFGLGCEMGISTQKMHARGPMGLEELNTYKYIIRSNGNIR